MAVTLKDVAERAGVSRSAVSRTYTDGASVSDKTRKKVERAAKALGYSPSLIARSLATNRTKLIGLVADNFGNPVFLEVFDRFTDELQKRGLRPLLVNLKSETDPESSAGLLRQYNVDGVILASSTLPTDFAAAFRDTGIPVIHAFGRHDTPAHVVGIDNERCGEMAAQTLIDRGYEAIALLAGPKTATSAQDRATGFERRMNAAGRAIVATHYASRYAYSAGRDAMAELLQMARPDAVFCGDDLIAIGGMDTARAQGLAIPDDIGILGFNDMSMAGWSALDLTTIRQPIGDIILSAVDLVVSMIETPDQTAKIQLFPCSVVERGTLRPLPA